MKKPKKDEIKIYSLLLEDGKSFTKGIKLSSFQKYKLEKEKEINELKESLEILSNSDLVKKLNKSIKDIDEGKYKILVDGKFVSPMQRIKQLKQQHKTKMQKLIDKIDSLKVSIIDDSDRGFNNALNQVKQKIKEMI